MDKKRPVLLLLVVCLCLACFCSCDINNEETTSWSNELEYEIKKAYAETYYGLTDEREFDPEDISLAYYGTYNGYHAIENVGLGSPVIVRKEVGGCTFLFGTSHIILMYKYGEFFDFDAAFRDGKISQKDIEELHKVYSGRIE